MRIWIPLSLTTLLACGPFFYQAPPSLGEYPERVATKTWAELFREKSPPDLALPAAEAMDSICRNLPDELAPLDTAARLAKIDTLLATNRAGGYSSQAANFLHELRELAADPAVFAAADAYLKWRTDPAAQTLGLVRPAKHWNTSDEDFAKSTAAYEAKLEEKIDFFTGKIATAEPAIRPHWLVREGAALFANGQYELAYEAFAEVVNGTPDHPRAEAALLMQARCRLEMAREAKRRANPLIPGAPEIYEPLRESEELLETFIAKYPSGRFTPDAYGWLGAAAFDRGDFHLAINRQFQRQDLQPTREIRRTVLRECDFIFSRMFEETFRDRWDFDAAAVAAHPLVARLFVQHALDPAAREMEWAVFHEDFDGGRLSLGLLNRKVFRSSRFTREALKALGEEMAKRNDPADPATLMILAWSATESGEHALALALNEKISPQDDGTVYQRALILQRLGRHAEAATAFDRFQRDFPGSPLALDVPDRRAISLFRSGRAGEAAVALLSPDFEGRESLGLPYQTRQMADAILQFAPLDQLENGLTGLDAGDRRLGILKTVIRCRALAAGTFQLAERSIPIPPQIDNDVSSNPVAAAAEKQAALIGGLRELYQKLAGAATPAVHLEIANYWFQHRGSLTFPAIGSLDFAGSETEKLDLLRRANALSLGFSRESVNAELDSHDEATHALAHALNAAQSADPAIAAPALELANECLFRRAEVSIYQRTRALESDATKRSREIYNRLKRLPGTPEGRRAIFYRFEMPAGAWMPGDSSPARSAAGIVAAVQDRESHDWGNPDAPALRSCGKLIDGIERMPDTTSISEIRAEVDRVAAEFEKTWASLPSGVQLDRVAALNKLRDLQDAALLDGISGADFLSYANGNRDALPPAFASFAVYESLATTGTPAGWEQYLVEFPDSPKAAAAALRLLRLKVRKSRGTPVIAAFHFPQAPIYHGHKHVEVPRPEAAPAPEVVLAAIDAYQARFPQSRYGWSVKLLRVGALIDQGKLAEALAILTAILDQPDQGDLHSIAALHLCEIGQMLLAPETRVPAAAVFHTSPRATELLTRLTRGDTYLTRLKPLLPWLRES